MRRVEFWLMLAVILVGAVHGFLEAVRVLVFGEAEEWAWMPREPGT